MLEKEQLISLCEKGLVERGLDNPRYRDRLRQELKEIDAQAEYEYYLQLYAKRDEERYPYNEHNLLVVYLLGVVSDFNIEEDYAFIQGEFPDIDSDFLPLVRDWVKNVWAAETFGKDSICSISTYGTLGIRSALLDVTKVHGISKEEIQQITKNLPDKDDEGEALDWDSAVRLCPEVNNYCERYPQIADAVKVLIDRNKSAGVHAGGLIISSVSLSDFVPLEVRSVNKDNKYGVIVSAWTEGQRVQDLQPVGLVKFDILGVETLLQIALTCKLIRERHPEMREKGICAGPNGRTWSDLSYLNDPECLKVANKGDLRCVFQFGSDGIRKLVKTGGVTSFHDLCAYSALYRPGPMGMKMDAIYCRRKRGQEKYKLHPLMQPILGMTHGVMVYQEQVMKILNVVGDIPLIHCEKIRKAISKKKIEGFAKYKEMFFINGMKNLGVDLEYIQNLWEQIESFADYGFNKSHTYAYCTTSGRQLWLKTYYPIEFYTALLMCEDEHDKIKAIKLDAMNHGVDLMQLDINKSNVNFSIYEDEDKERIYYGFSNLKKIGEQVAERVVPNQPYESFTDFLNKFGTEANVLKALISIGAFGQIYDRLFLYKFYLYYKDWRTKWSQKQARFGKALERYDNDLRDLVEEFATDKFSVVVDNTVKEAMCRFDDEAYSLWETYFSEISLDETYNYKGEARVRKITALKLFHEVKRKRESSMKNYAVKESDAEDGPMALSDFEPNRFKIDLDPEVQTLFLGDTRLAEKTYYGFQWTHPIEESEFYSGLTIDKFLGEDYFDKIEAIEVQIEAVEIKTAKNGNLYTVLQVEDANGAKIGVTVWGDDYERFKDEMVEGALIRIRVKQPDGKFPNLTFESPKRHERRFLPNKESDCRLFLMGRVEAPKLIVKESPTPVMSLEAELLSLE